MVPVTNYIKALAATPEPPIELAATEPPAVTGYEEHTFEEDASVSRLVWDLDASGKLSLKALEPEYRNRDLTPTLRLNLC